MSRCEDFGVDSERSGRSRPETSPAILKGTTGFLVDPEGPSSIGGAHEKRHVDGDAEVEAVCAYYSLYRSPVAGEGRNPRLPRPPFAGRFARDQRPSAGVITTLFQPRKPPQARRRCEVGPPVPPSELLNFAGSNATEPPIAPTCPYAGPGTYSKWWRDSSNIMGTVLGFCQASDLPVIAVSCSQWNTAVRHHAAAPAGVVTDHIRGTQCAAAKAAEIVADSKAAAPTPVQAARLAQRRNVLSSRVQHFLDCGAATIQRQFRRAQATSGAQRTLALLHIVRDQLGAARGFPAAITMDGSATAKGYLLEIALEYEYQLHVVNVASRLVFEARRAAGEGGEEANSSCDAAQPRTWLRRAVLRPAELDEVYANVEQGYSDSMQTFAAEQQLPELATFLSSVANARVFQDVFHRLVCGRGGWCRLGWIKGSFGDSSTGNSPATLERKCEPGIYSNKPSAPLVLSPTISSAVDADTAHNVCATNLIPHEKMPLCLRFVQDQLAPPARMSVKEELLHAAQNVDAEWFGGAGVTAEQLVAAATQTAAEVPVKPVAEARGSPDKCSEQSKSAGATASGTTSESGDVHVSAASLHPAAGARSVARFHGGTLTAAPRVDQAILDRVIPPPLPPHDAVCSFKWPERLDPALRKATELDFEDDPELQYQDPSLEVSSASSDSAASSDENGEDHGVASATRRKNRKRHLSLVQQLRRFDAKEQRRRATVQRALDAAHLSVNGSRVVASDDTDATSGQALAEIDCSLLRGGKATKEGCDQRHTSSQSGCPRAATAAATTCCVCELSGEGTRQCACMRWVHDECAMGRIANGQLKCCSSCAPP